MADDCAAWDDRYYDPQQLRTLAGTTGLPEVFLVANDLMPPQHDQMSGGIRQAIGGRAGDRCRTTACAGATT